MRFGNEVIIFLQSIQIQCKRKQQTIEALLLHLDTDNKQKTYGGYKECWNETVFGVGKGTDIFNVEVSLTADTASNHSNGY